jgi:hypothetical protein
MRTNIELDDKLLSEAMHLTGLKTKRAVVDEALRTLLKVRKRKSLLDLQGKLSFAPDFDHKALRQTRNDRGRYFSAHRFAEGEGD